MIRISIAIPIRSKCLSPEFARRLGVELIETVRARLPDDPARERGRGQIRMTRGSLTARVLLLATLWAVIALVAIAIVISQLYRNGSERAFADLLRAQLNSVINTVSINDNGQLVP